MRSFWIVGNDLQVALKLSHQAGDHLEAQAGARIDVEAVGKANALVGNFNVKMSLHFAGVDLDRASTFWLGTFDSVGHQFVNQEPQGDGVVA